MPALIRRLTKSIQEFRHCLSPVMIISYEMFLRCHEKIQDIRFDLVVCDEGHRLKNAGRKTTTVQYVSVARFRMLIFELVWQYRQSMGCQHAEE
jgi:SNF2 family DNA or RNA helicase